jgi:hypothetical protein
MKKLILTTTACLAVAACQPTTEAADADPLASALSGRTLVADNAEINVGADGSLTGRLGTNLENELVGAWTVRNGQWCRTITEPARLAGTECQDATVNADGTVTFVGDNRTTVYALR